MEIKLYMIDQDKDKENVSFLSSGELQRKFSTMKVDPDIYKEVYTGKVKCTDLEDVYQLFNIDNRSRPRDYSGRSMSVSDVVEVTKGSRKIKRGLYYCDNVGFKKMEDWSKEQETEKSETIKVVMIEPGKEAREETIGTSLEELQKAVGGYIETYYPFDDSAVIVCNDEGKLNGMKPNRGIYDDKGQMMDIIFGPFFICDAPGEDFASLSKDQLDKYLTQFRQPEVLGRENGQYVMSKIKEAKEKER